MIIEFHSRAEFNSLVCVETIPRNEIARNAMTFGRRN